MLVEIAIKTGGKVADCDAVFASSNKYKATQDHFTAFFGEKIVQCSGESCSCNTGKQKDKCRMKMRDVLEVFKTFDEGNKEFIDLKDLKRVLKEYNENLTNEEFNILFKETDNDKDGKINFRDFLSKFENVGIPDEWFFVNILIKIS